MCHRENPRSTYHGDKILIAHLLYWDIMDKSRNDGSWTRFFSKINLLQEFSGQTDKNLEATHLYVKTICVRMLHHC
jgi:hypothetical protein